MSENVIDADNQQVSIENSNIRELEDIKTISSMIVKEIEGINGNRLSEINRKRLMDMTLKLHEFQIQLSNMKLD